MRILAGAGPAGRPDSCQCVRMDSKCFRMSKSGIFLLGKTAVEPTRCLHGHLVPFWVHFWPPFGSRSGPKLVQIWSKTGPDLVQNLVPIRSRSGPKLVQIWSRTGPNLVQNWSQSGPDLVPFWRHAWSPFGSVLNPVLDPPGSTGIGGWPKSL